MTNLQYFITTTLLLGLLLLLCIPAYPLPTSSSISAEKDENDATTPGISQVQGSSSQEGNSESGTGYNNPHQEVSYTLKPPSFNNFDQYGNPLSRGNPLPSGNQNQLLSSGLFSAYQPHPSVHYRTKSSLTLPSTTALTQQNMRIRQLNQRLLSKTDLRRGRYMYPNMYPTQYMYPYQYPYSYTPMPNVIPPPVNNAQPYYPQYGNVYPNPDAIYPYPNTNYYLTPHIYNQNEQSQTSSSQTTQQQNTNNVPSQDQEYDHSNANQNSVQNQPGNQNVPQQPNVSQNGSQNHTENQNQTGYPYSDMQNGGGQNIYPGGMYPIQNINQFPNGFPIPYGGPDYNAPVITVYQNPFPFGYQMPNKNAQYRPITT